MDKFINIVAGNGACNIFGKRLDRPTEDIGPGLFLFLALLLVVILAGCQNPTQYRQEADKVAADIITEKQQQALGKTEPFTIERPSDIFRRRLLKEQGLLYSGEASIGADELETIEHWPEDEYPSREPDPTPLSLQVDEGAPKLSLSDALQIGARNSFEYQSYKEAIFQAALDLDLERNEFRNIFTGDFASGISTDSSSGSTVTGTENSGGAALNRTFKNGVDISTSLAIDLVNLLSSGGKSAFGISGDASVSIPLLRGSGRHIITEPLTQAERNVIYKIYDFERFKQTFAIQIAREYLGVLRRYDEVENAEENYRRRIQTARRSRRLADAGRLPEIQVDQVVQDELSARNQWIRTHESYKNTFDLFKNLLSLPPDAKIKLDQGALEKLIAPAQGIVDEIVAAAESLSNGVTPPADTEIEFIPPDKKNAGPMEIDETVAIKLGLENRLDLRRASGEVYDAQRAVVVAADALGAELTLFGSANYGQGRSLGSVSSDDGQLRFDRAAYSALLTLDLPIERTAERNLYRNSFILLEQETRAFQILEDQIKLNIRSGLRDLLEFREGLRIQAQALYLAQKRVRSVDLFLEAGRAQIRDLLEAQRALISAQNALTSAVVNYRIAELELQSDMGVLEVNEKGLWQEYSPEEVKHARR
ncbi:MAG: TolC family protein [Planctomycetota bacterium]